MRKCKDYDDIDLDGEYWHQGNPIRFTNPEIRRMLTLAKAGENDIFCDFGSGFAQNLIMALTEFGVKKAVGVEIDPTRASRSEERLKYLHLNGRTGKIEFKRFEDLPDYELEKVTILFYGLSGGDEIISRLRKLWQGTKIPHRLIWNDIHLIPEVFPNEVDYPFFMTQFPEIKKSYTQKEWLAKVVLQPEFALKKDTKRTQDELWKEFAHNLDVLEFRNELADYKDRLKTATRAKIAKAPSKG